MRIERGCKKRRSEHGYALVALMGVILAGLILMTAAAPSIKFETQREREEEMLWRGQQVSSAISRFLTLSGGQYPTDLKKLVVGIEIGTKKIRLLRPSAFCDPMFPCEEGATNWRLVRPGDPLVKELLDAYVTTQQKGNIMLPPPPANLVALAQIGSIKLPGQSTDANDANTDANGGDSGLGADNDDKEKRPIVGVVSRKGDRMFRSYFGIEYYDHSLFFPGVNVVAGGFINPMLLAGSFAAGGNNSSGQCPKGGVYINGQCWGAIQPGKFCRGPNGETVPCSK